MLGEIYTRTHLKLFLLIALIVVGTVFGKSLFLQFLPYDNSIQGYAEKVVAICSRENYRPACYEREIPKLLASISMEDAFKVTSLVQEKDGSYRYCHVLGHKLSAGEVKKNPSKWRDVLVRCPSGLCATGCIHGGLQEHFKGSEYLSREQIVNIKPDLKNLCEEKPDWQPTRLEQGSCYHALGHIAMYLTNGNIDKATTLCDEIAKTNDGRDYSKVCFDGAFMQIYQPLEPEDFALTKGKEIKREDQPFFCNHFSGEKRLSCISESWPLFIRELNQSSGLFKFCSQFESPDHEKACYATIVYAVSLGFNFDPEKMKSYCGGLPESKSGWCFASAATRLIEVDYRNIGQSVYLCLLAKPFDKNGDCFKGLIKFSTYNFHKSSDEFLKLCQSLPGSWSKDCLSQTK